MKPAAKYGIAAAVVIALLVAVGGVLVPAGRLSRRGRPGDRGRFGRGEHHDHCGRSDTSADRRGDIRHVDRRHRDRASSTSSPRPAPSPGSASTRSCVRSARPPPSAAPATSPATVVDRRHDGHRGRHRGRHDDHHHRTTPVATARSRRRSRPTSSRPPRSRSPSRSTSARAPTDGEPVSVTATGDLTIHGVTKSVQIPHRGPAGRRHGGARRLDRDHVLGLRRRGALGAGGALGVRHRHPRDAAAAHQGLTGLSAPAARTSRSGAPRRRAARCPPPAPG